MKILLAVFIGGGIGSVLRYLISKMTANFSLALPLSTLISNVLSCLILAITVFVFSKYHTLDKIWQVFILVGFCGGLSTFSTFSYETLLLIKSENYFWAVLNIILSLSITLVLLYLLLKKVNL